MKRGRLIKLWLTIAVCCAGLAACVLETPSSEPTTTPVSVGRPLPSATSGPVLFFARDDDLWRATMDGERLERLTQGGVLDWRENDNPDWVIDAVSRRPQVSPDGRWIVVIQSGLEFILIDLAFGTQTTLAGPGALDVAWSPDSRAFAYAPQSRTDDVELRVYSVEGGEVDTLLNVERTTGLGIRDIVWSPDNRFIAFGCCFEGSEPEASTGTLVGDIRVVEVATGEIESVGKTEAHVASRSRLCWTADGQVVTSPEEGIVCSSSPPMPNVLSPSGMARAVLAPLAPEDEIWTGPSRLTVSLPASGQTLWEREISGNVKTVAWAPVDARGYSAYLFVDDYELHSPIRRIAADGSCGLEEIVVDGFLLGVVSQWQQGLSAEVAATDVHAVGASATTFPAPSATPAPPTPSLVPPARTWAPTRTPTPIVELELSVDTYPLARLPEPESDTLDFAASVEGDPLARHAARRAQNFPDPTCSVGGHFAYCAKLGNDRFAAWMDETDPEVGYVVVARNEEQVTSIHVGATIGAIPNLWGVWAYDGHWAVETALVGTVQSGNVFTSTAIGQVVMDGVSLNEELGYDETFSFQTLGGKPFYFFERQGVVDVSYDGVDIPLGFDEVPHLFCCSAAAFNPEPHPNLVTFYGRKGDRWYYGEIAAVPATPDETPTPRAKVPNRTPAAVLGTPEILAEEAIDCTPAGAFSHCVDDVLGIEFEVPASWGGIETRLRRGLDAGFAYDYYFDGKTHAETEPLVAGGRSGDFAEGRGAMPTDFGGYDDAGWQRTSACAGSGEWFSNSYPVCRQINDHVAWMIRFPNAEALCSGDLTGWTATPVFRIEISLPDNPTINGFVFEAPFFSEQFATLVESDLYRRIGISVNWEPRRCDEASKEAFDAELARLIDSIMERTADAETVEKVDDLIHLAESIAVRER